MNNESNPATVPYIVYESEMVRADRYIKRLWIALITVTICFAAAVISFFWYLSLYDFTSYDYEQDGTGVNIVGDENGVDYDGAESIDTQENEERRQSERAGYPQAQENKTLTS